MNSSILFNASPGVSDRRLYHNLQIQQSDGLIEINDDGNAVLKVDTTSTISGNRKSVRITTENTFTGTYDALLLSYNSDQQMVHIGGIFVLDAVHMPQGCGSWP